MDRQQAMICIAKMNRYSRQISTTIEAGTALDLKRIAPEIGDVIEWGEDILNFLHKNPIYELVREISAIYEPCKIVLYLKSNKKLKADTKIFLKEFVQTTGKLQDSCCRIRHSSILSLLK